jgi:2'-5' RNA ligase
LIESCNGVSSNCRLFYLLDFFLELFMFRPMTGRTNGVDWARRITGASKNNMDAKATLFTVPDDSPYNGVMIALFPSAVTAQQIAAVAGVTVPVEELHVTLAYAGGVDMLTDAQIAGAILAAKKVATYSEPLTGTINGLGRFNASQSSDGKDVIYAVVDLPGLDEVRKWLGKCMGDYEIQPIKNHGYTPHMTLAYIDTGTDSPISAMPTMPIRFDAISVAVGGRRVDYPLMSMEWEEDDEDEGEHKAVDTNALKAISRTDTELRVGNYMVLFGGRDLEGIATPRKNKDGSTGEYFTKSTTFESPYTETGVLHIDWEHSVGAEGLGQDDVLGYVDWKSARIDDKGLFVERVLNRRNRYVQFVEELIDAGLIGNSTEAVSDGVVKATNGEIKAWPLRRDTLTVSPMEPRMLTQNAIVAIKALAEHYPALKAMLDDTPTEGKEQQPEPEASTPETGSAPVVLDAVDGSSIAPTGDNTAEMLSIELDLLLLED